MLEDFEFFSRVSAWFNRLVYDRQADEIQRRWRWVSLGVFLTVFVAVAFFFSVWIKSYWIFWAGVIAGLAAFLVYPVLYFVIESFKPKS